MRWPTLVALACLAGCDQGGSGAAKGSEPVPVRVTCAPVTQETIATHVELRGTISAPPLAQAVVASTVPGRIVKLLVEEGDTVTAHQLVAVMEDPNLGATAQQSGAEVTVAEAELRAATSDRARRETLVGEGIAPQKDLDQARAREDAARASVEAARARSKLARGQLARTDLRAPRAGTVLRVLKTAGSVVDVADTSIIEIADLSVLELRAQVMGADLIGLTPGTQATVILDAIPGTSGSGEIVAVARALDPLTSLGSVRIRLTLPAGWSPPIGLPGVATVARSPRVALLAPSAAFRRALDGTDEVLVCADDHAKVRAVELGERTADGVEVRAGLAAGDAVIVDRVLGIEDGAAIEVGR